MKENVIYTYTEEVNTEYEFDINLIDIIDDIYDIEKLKLLKAKIEQKISDDLKYRSQNLIQKFAYEMNDEFATELNSWMKFYNKV